MAARGFEFGVSLQDQNGVLAGHGEQVFVFFGVGQAVAGEAGLFGAQIIAGAAGAKIFVGDGKTVFGLFEER